ncbi:RloB family protein [Fundicoccus sp. Sow4_H7]|uniref:RloB family protein n=1 Tax=Fundicoccus sp. Sow4_H7 TaxID=3438784 RepID=UPI003F8E4290
MPDTKESRFSRISRDIDTQTVEVTESILIVCEGEKTEPNYFKKFPVSNLKVEVDGRGSNTIDLVEYAIYKKDQQEYDSVWCVFDKDSFPNSNFNEACRLAKNKDIELAYSVESFELWYLLHFEYLNTGIHRNQYVEKLDKIFQQNFSITYTKNSEEIYRLLSNEKQQNALKLARKLAEQYKDEDPPATRYPVTYVYRLVEKLNQYLLICSP